MNPYPAVTPADIPDSIDGLEMVMIRSSVSAVSAGSTRFRYHQDGHMLYGQYSGDTVDIGRFVGRRDGNELTICFTHLPVCGDIAMGIAHSTLRRGDDGKLYLDEVFEKDGVKHESQCVEVDADASWPASTRPLGVSTRVSEPQIDGTSFVLQRSTASEVHPTEPTRFDFEESAGVVWGRYRGDTVSGGYTVGRYRNSVLDEYFVHHHIAKDETLLGESKTTLRQHEDGRLELIEEFVLDGVPGYSVCVQVRE